MKPMKKIKVDPRELIFLQLISLIAAFDSPAIKSLAIRARVHFTTLYHWRNGPTVAPRIDTLARVALAVGHEITLTPVVRKPRLTRVK